MIAVTYLISAQEPLLVTALSGEPNSAVAFPYIPGSAIRGLVAGLWRARYQQDDLPLRARALLFDGQTCYLNAYLADGQKRRRLPAPLSWRKEKSARSGQDDVEDHACLPPQESQLQAPVPVAGFVAVDDDEVSVATPQRTITVHTLRDRFAGRPTEERGAVYRYDALAADQYFAGAILVPTPDVAQQVLSLLQPGFHKLGGAATAGYGQVALDDIQVKEDWWETGVAPRAIAAGEEFTVTVLSDAILRDTNGATTSDLVRALGWAATELRSFRKTTPVGTFNRTWGLPTPQAWALRAGSVFVLQADASIGRDAVEVLVNRGVGERRAEGFGRVAVNWQRQATLHEITASQWSPALEPARLSGASETLARRMMIRRQRQELDRELIKAIQQRPIRHAPPNNQLSRVRIITRSALGDRDLGRIADLFSEDVTTPQGGRVTNARALRDNALKKFHTARVGHERLSDWIAELAGAPERVWEMLTLRPAVPLGHIEVEEEHARELAKEYAARLIDGVLGQAMSKRRSEGNGPARPDDALNQQRAAQGTVLTEVSRERTA